MKETIKRQRLFFISLIGIVVVSLVMGTTFAYQTIVIDKQEGASTDVSLNIGKLNVSYTKNNENIYLTNMQLLNNYKSADYIELVINSNDSTDDVAYQITLKGLEYSPILASADFKYTLTELIDENEVHIKTGDFSSLTSTEFTLMDGNFKYLKKGNSQTIRLYLWLEETSEVQNDFEKATFKGQIQISSVYANETTSDIALLNGTVVTTYSNNFKVNLTTNEAIEDNEIATKAISYPFKVENIGNTHQNITIKLTDIEMSEELKDIDFRWGLYNANTEKSVSLGFFRNLGTENEKILLKDVILDKGSEIKNYILRIWVHNNGTSQDSLIGKSFKANLNVSGAIIEYTPESCFTMGDDWASTYIKDYDVETCGTDVVIPKTINGNKITTIGGYTTDGMTYLRPFADKGITSLILPDIDANISGGLEDLYLPMFYGNNLKHITIPESINMNHKYIFAELGLKSIISPEGKISAGNIAGNDISEFVFTGDLEIAKGYNNYNSLKVSDIVLMDGFVNKISEFSLGSPNLTTIEIPASVTRIDAKAFVINDTYGSYSPLTKIVIRGKSSLSEFTGGYEGVTELENYEDIIEFRP